MESLHIKTFGAAESQNASCDLVQLGLVTQNDGMIKTTSTHLDILP